MNGFREQRGVLLAEQGTPTHCGDRLFEKNHLPSTRSDAGYYMLFLS